MTPMLSETGSKPTDYFLDANRCARIRERSGADFIDGGDFELVHDVRLEFRQLVLGLGNFLSGRRLPLGLVLRSTVDHVVRDLSTAVVLRRSPVQNDRRVQNIGERWNSGFSRQT